jgi:hypothetical protein
LDPDAVGIWNFDEGSMDTCPGGQDACDISGWNNHCTAYGNVSYITDTPSGQGRALSFDGDGDYLDCGNDNSLRPANFTLGVWYYKYPASTDYDHVIGNFGGNVNYGYAVSVRYDGQTQFSVGYGTNRSSPEVAGLVLDNQWTYLVFTFDGTNLKGYKNSDNVPGYSVVIGGTLVYELTQPLTIGSRRNASDWNYLNGLVDEVRVYDTVLTVSQIESQYYAGLNKLLSRNLIDEQEYQERLLTRN